MSEKKQTICDGRHECQAIVIIKDGKVTVSLNSMFDLPAGATLPLLREDHNLLVEVLHGGQIEFFNGHAII
ncbi:MAG: hypothetical protein V4719_21990 [Planctomycetota bacterium]